MTAAQWRSLLERLLGANKELEHTQHHQFKGPAWMLAEIGKAALDLHRHAVDLLAELGTEEQEEDEPPCLTPTPSPDCSPPAPPGSLECAAALADYLMERGDMRGHRLRARYTRWQRARAKALAARDEVMAPLLPHLNELTREIRRLGGVITWKIEGKCFAAQREDALFKDYVRRLMERG